MTYGDLSETASASISGARVFRMQQAGCWGSPRAPQRRSCSREQLGRFFRGLRPAEAKDWLCGLEAAGKQDGIVCSSYVPVHDVSIRRIVMEGCGYRGCVPRSKNSMTIMRPPQQGQGGKTVSAGSS